MVENVAEAKRVLREGVLKNRSIDLAKSSEAQLTIQLMKLIRELKPTVVGCYLSFGAEPRTWEFVKTAQSDGYTIACPRTAELGRMEFAEFDGETLKSSLGFEEPTGPAISATLLELLIIPALAIDKNGERLGRGGGYFDRFLPEVGCPIAAVVFDGEVVESLPSEPHDISVDYAVTQSEILRF